MAYKVKVKVVEKGRPKTSPQKNVLYQSIVLQDDRGNRMKGALFGDQVDGYKDAFVYNGEYEISNAPIKHCDPRYKMHPREVDFQMTFGRQTLIQPIDIGENSTGPQFQCLANIPKAVGHADKFDMLGVILFVEETARTVRGLQERDHIVREIVVTDHSTEQPITISTWNDLAEADSELLSTWAEKFHVIGLTALKVSGYKGFSLATTMSTSIIHSPASERATALEAWVQKHQELLSDRQARVMTVRDPSSNQLMTTLRDLRTKKVGRTLQEERHMLHVNVPETDLSKVNAYVGCSNCARRTDVPIGGVFTCHLCSKEECVATLKVTFNCEVTDGTGTLAITTFTEDTEKIFRMPVADIFHLKHSDDVQGFEIVKELLKTNKFIVEVGPKSTMLLNRVLQWILRKLIVQTDDNEPLIEHASGNTLTCDAIQKDQAGKAALEDIVHPTETSSLAADKVHAYGKETNSSTMCLVPNSFSEKAPTPTLASQSSVVLLQTPHAQTMKVTTADELSVEFPQHIPQPTKQKRGVVEQNVPTDQTQVQHAGNITTQTASEVQMSDHVQATTDTIQIASAMLPTKRLKLITPKVEQQSIQMNKDKSATTPN